MKPNKQQVPTFGTQETDENLASGTWSSRIVAEFLVRCHKSWYAQTLAEHRLRSVSDAMCFLFGAPAAVRTIRQRGSRRLPRKRKAVAAKSKRVTSRAPLRAGAALVIIEGTILAAASFRKRSRSEKLMQALAQGVAVLSSRPHSEQSFTQGLVWAQGGLWESTGLVGMSRVRKLGGDSAVVESVAESYNPGNEFGEGLARFTADGSKLVQLTWRD